MEALQLMFTQTDIARSEVDDKLGDLATAISDLSRKMQTDETTAALNRIAESQERLISRLGDVGEGIDPESRMRLRSIDVQMLRILEELSAGRQEAVADLKSELSSLSRALRQSKPRPTRPLHTGVDPTREQSGG
jgi:hypothetical protein